MRLFADLFFIHVSKLTLLGIIHLPQSHRTTVCGEKGQEYYYHSINDKINVYEAIDLSSIFTHNILSGINLIFINGIGYIYNINGINHYKKLRYIELPDNPQLLAIIKSPKII